MRNDSKFSRAAQGICVALAMLVATSVPAPAERWPAGGPSLGGAIAARAIADACPSLMSEEQIAELEFYIKKRRAEIAAISAEDAASVNAFAPALEAEYARSERCTDDSEEMAKDMLERVERLLEFDDLESNPNHR